MSETKLNRPGCNQTSTTGIAERLRWIISEIEQLGDQQIPQVYVHVGLQVMNDGPERWPQRKHLIETLAAVFGAIPKYEDGLYTAAVEQGLSIYGSCPPPPQERREKLLAELAVVDAEIAAAEAFESDEPAAVVHEEVRAWGGMAGECGVECACGLPFDGFDTIADARSYLDKHIADEALGLHWGEAAPLPVTVADAYASMERAAQQLRTSQTGDEFAAGVGSFMDALAAAAEDEDEDESERAS